jgi:hypothetical protein
MNRPPQPLLLLALLGAMAAAAAPSTDDGAGRTASWDRYRVLSERNIFVRDRWRPPVKPVSSGPAPLIDPDSRLVLTGIGQEGSETAAFIEDTRTGLTLRARTGDAVGKGKLAEISLDCIEYECEGSIRRIEIGTTLAGSTAWRTPTQTAATTQPAAPLEASTSAPAVPADILSIEERMRRQRQQQLGR